MATASLSAATKLCFPRHISRTIHDNAEKAMSTSMIRWSRIIIIPQTTSKTVQANNWWCEMKNYSIWEPRLDLMIPCLLAAWCDEFWKLNPLGTVPQTVQVCQVSCFLWKSFTFQLKFLTCHLVYKDVFECFSPSNFIYIAQNHKCAPTYSCSS